MAIYSIGDLAKISGVKAPTLRIWEQRYGILTPKRTPGNARYYDDDDLRHLLNVALLNRNGLRISRIAKLGEAELLSRAAEIADLSDEYATQLDALTLSMLEMDELRFDRLLSVNIEQFGFERTMLEVLMPFLDKLTVLWVTGSVKPIQERFTAALILRKLLVAIQQLPHPTAPRAPALALYLPPGESQEMSLVLLHYLAKRQGYRVYYLGAEVAAADVADACAIVAPDLLFTMVSETFAGGGLDAYAAGVLEAAGPRTRLLLSGYQVAAQGVESRGRLLALASLQQTLDALRQYKSTAGGA